jgi:hypothetical protein
MREWIAIGMFSVVEVNHKRNTPIGLFPDLEGTYNVGHKAVKQNHGAW